MSRFRPDRVDFYKVTVSGSRKAAAARSCPPGSAERGTRQKLSCHFKIFELFPKKNFPERAAKIRHVRLQSARQESILRENNLDLSFL